MSRHQSKSAFERALGNRATRLLLTLGCLAVFCSVAWATPTINSPAVTPSSIPVGTPTTVTFTASITDPSITTTGINLQQLGANGSTFTNVATLYDDGTHGDAVAGDQIFSTQLTLNQPSPFPLTFRISAPVKGSLTRIFSSLITLKVTGNAPALVTLTSPPHLAFENSSPVTVSGTVTDPSASVTVNGLPAPVSGGSFTLSVPIQEGNNILTASAFNSQGTVTTSSVQVTLDTTPPRISIDTPYDGYATTDASITVSGKANDTVVGTVNSQQVSVTVNGIAATVANRSFQALNVPLALGSNTIVVSAHDRAGNGATSQITVRRDNPTQSIIKIISGNNQTGAVGSALSTPIVAGVVDGAGNPVSGQVVVFTVTQNNGTLDSSGTVEAVTTDSLGHAQAHWKLGTRSGAGNNIVEATSVGFADSAIFTASGTPGSPGQISLDTGNDQMGEVGQPLPYPYVTVISDAFHNRLANVPVTFNIKQGGGTFGGQTSITTNSDSDGRTAAVLTLGPNDGIENNVVEANFSGNTGFPAAFSSSGHVPGNPAATTITGVVLDNSNNPVPGATIRVYLQNVPAQQSGGLPPAVTAQSDLQGQFTVQPAPVGFVKIIADGSTVTLPGKWPNLEYDLVTVSGQTNTIGLPIYLLPIDTQHQLCVSDTQGGTLTVPALPGFSLAILPSAATFPGGSKTGCVSVTEVHPDKIPMVPDFGQQPRFIVTVQPAGTLFSPPAAVTIPNAEGLAPRTVTEMYSFDHDLAAFVTVGSGTVSDDGSIVRSDPGVGILKAGWFSGGPPTPVGTVAVCGACKAASGNACAKDPMQDGHACPVNGSAGICSDNNGNCIPITISIDSIWSSQFQGVTVNGLPAMAPPDIRGAGVTGEKSNYVLMATNANGMVAVGGDLTITPDSDQVRSQILIQLKNLSSGASEGTGSVDSDDAASATTQAPSQTQDYTLLAGVDLNGNNTLDANEIIATSAAKYRVVPASVYTSVVSSLNSDSGFFPSLVLPNAANLLSSFVNNKTPSGSTASTNATLTVDTGTLNTAPPLPYQMWHAVGALFNDLGTAPIPYFKFPASSTYADTIRTSNTVAGIISATYQQHLTEIDNYFAENSGVGSYTFGPWQFAQTGHVAFYQECSVVTVLNPACDLRYAIGTGYLLGSVKINVFNSGILGLSLTGATIVGGTLSDLYDANYDLTGLNQMVATVQAGFNTLGNGGQVYTYSVMLDGDISFLTPP